MSIPTHFSSLIPDCLAISCLTTVNWPWLTALTFQVLKQCCSLQHWTSLSPADTSTTGHHFALAQPLHFSWTISVLFHSSILDTYWPSGVIFQCPIFLPFHTVHGALKARILKWFAIPFSSGPAFVRTLHHAPSWVALHGMAHSFIELHKNVIPVIILAHFLWLWLSFWRPWDCSLASSVCPQWMRIRGLCKLPGGRGRLWGKLGLVLVYRAMISKSLVQFSLGRWGCAPSL